MQNCTHKRRRCVHSSGNKGYNKTTESHLSRAPPWWGWGTVCSVNTDFPSQSGSVHREPSPSCQMLMEAFLRVKKQATQLERRRQSVLVRAVVWGTEADCERHTRRYWSLPCLKEKCPLHVFTGQRHQSGFDTPPAEPPAQVGSIASRVLTGSTGRYGPAGSPRTPARPRGNRRPRPTPFTVTAGVRSGA